MKEFIFGHGSVLVNIHLNTNTGDLYLDLYDIPGSFSYRCGEHIVPEVSNKIKSENESAKTRLTFKSIDQVLAVHAAIFYGIDKTEDHIKIKEAYSMWHLSICA